MMRYLPFYPSSGRVPISTLRRLCDTPYPPNIKAHESEEQSGERLPLVTDGRIRYDAGQYKQQFDSFYSKGVIRPRRLAPWRPS
jgi:hypothetical protein